MKKVILMFAALVAAAPLALEGCTPERKTYEWEWEDPVKEQVPDQGNTDEPGNQDTPAQREETNQDIVDLGWTNVCSDFGEIPEYISVYRSPDEMQGRKAIAFIAVADMAKAKWEVTSFKDLNNGGSTSPLRTPSTAYSECGNPPIIINGGYFYSSGGKNYSASLVVSNGELLSPNITYASQDWVTMYYPTRGIFVEHADGSFEAAWSYKSSAGHWIYPDPSPNVLGETPCKVPSATFPEGAVDFEARTGIGGGPVLIRDGEIRNDYASEMFDGMGGVNPDNPNTPRTAIGATDDGRMILFVCEGRSMTEGVVGFTTAEVAQIMKELGCVEALNLDGGGSTCMLVAGEETIKPSDKTQRKVASLVYLY